MQPLRPSAPPVAGANHLCSRAFHNPRLNMDYLPRTPPAFPGDRQHDFRDHQADARLETLSDWVGTAADHYLRAAHLLGTLSSDPIAHVLQADPIFDARTLWVAHDLLAAWFRCNVMPGILKGPIYIGPPGHKGHLSHSYAGLLWAFRHWLTGQTDHWARWSPHTLRLMLLSVVKEHTASGRNVEEEFFRTLADIFPLPGLTVPKPLVNPFP